MKVLSMLVEFAGFVSLAVAAFVSGGLGAGLAAAGVLCVGYAALLPSRDRRWVPPPGKREP